MEIFKQLNKKGYKHYYEGTVEELDFMDKDNQHLHSEIMQVIMWLYKKHGIWIVAFPIEDGFWAFDIFDYESDCIKSGMEFNSPTEAYEAAIKYILNELI